MCAIDPGFAGTCRRSVPERVKLLAWKGGGGVFMMVAGSQAATSHGNAMTSNTTNENSPAAWAVTGPRPRMLRTRMADDDRKRKGGESGPGTAVITKTKPQTKKPSMYRVLILNDDYTPMEFVVHVLERFFGKDHEAATRIMLHVHHHGIGECGIYTYEVAETKVTQVMDFARKHQHPLQCVMEKK
jgi:ATP-dependent Clp protease adaptor protein ClpS